MDFKSDIAYFENTFQKYTRDMEKGQVHFTDLFILVNSGSCNFLFVVNLGKNNGPRELRANYHGRLASLFSRNFGFLGPA